MSSSGAAARRVAVVGGGIAGLTLARELARAGDRVRVFDKGRGAGGRASTRREGDRRFDHGAQYFTVKDSRFGVEVEGWRRVGLAAEWPGQVAVIDSEGIRIRTDQPPRYVGVPGMNAIVKALADECQVEFGTRVEALARAGDRWRLVGEGGRELEEADRVILALPPEQALPFLEAARSPLEERVRPLSSEPCWALLVAFPERLELDFDGAFVHSAPVAWVARDASKPGRSPGERWVVHAGGEWSREHLEVEREAIAPQLLAAFFQAVQIQPRDPAFLHAHRWRYARVEAPLDVGGLWDSERQIGVCGDWCHRSRVEGAYLSGLDLAERLGSESD